MLDRSNESTRWQIAHTFAQWTTRAAVQSQGRHRNFKKDQAAVNSYIEAVDFNRPFDRSLGSIGEDEFSDWHSEQVRRLMSCHENINVGWAAKMIAIYLKVTCYLSGFGRECLDSVIHPPFDSNLMEGIAEHNYQTFGNLMSTLQGEISQEQYDAAMRNSEEVRRNLSNARIRDIDDTFYWEVLIPACEQAAESLNCTLIEVEQLWTPI